MFRVVEQEDGSTAIFDRSSGRLMSILPASPPKGFHNKIPVSSTVTTSSSVKRSLNSSLDSHNNNNNYHSDSKRFRRNEDESSSSSASLLAVEASSLRMTSTSMKTGNLLEDKSHFLRRSSLRMNGHSNGCHSTTASKSKPDHFVVVFNDEIPSRMKLLPAETLEEIVLTQDRMHGSKSFCKTYFHSSRDHHKPNEPDTDCLDQASYHKYLDLIPTTTLEKVPLMELKHQWPLRLQSRTPRYPYVQSRSSLLGQQRQQQLQQHHQRQQHLYSSFQGKDHPVSQIKSGKPLQVINSKQMSSSASITQVQSADQQQNPAQMMTRADLERLQWLQGIKARQSFVAAQKTPQTMIQQTSSNHLIMRQSIGQEHSSDLKTMQSFNNSTSSVNDHQNELLDRKQVVKTGEQRMPRMMIQDPDLLKPFYDMTSSTADFISRQDNKKVLVKRFVNKYFSKPSQYYRPGMELSSPLGRRLLESFCLALGLSSVREMRKMIKFYERFCGTDSLTHRQLLATLKATSFSSKIKIDLTALPSPEKGNCLTSRLLRSQQMINPQSNAWGLKSYHIYTFSKQERMEKMKTLESGLDWKGRLLSMHCQIISLDVVKITQCESCFESISPDQGHVCGLSKEVSPNSTPTKVTGGGTRPTNVVVPNIKVVPVAATTTATRSSSSNKSKTVSNEEQSPTSIVNIPSTRSRERIQRQQQQQLERQEGPKTRMMLSPSKPSLRSNGMTRSSTKFLKTPETSLDATLNEEEDMSRNQDEDKSTILSSVGLVSLSVLQRDSHLTPSSSQKTNCRTSHPQLHYQHHSVVVDEEDLTEGEEFDDEPFDEEEAEEELVLIGNQAASSSQSSSSSHKYLSMASGNSSMEVIIEF